MQENVYEQDERLRREGSQEKNNRGQFTFFSLGSAPSTANGQITDHFTVEDEHRLMTNFKDNEIDIFDLLEVKRGTSNEFRKSNLRIPNNLDTPFTQYGNNTLLILATQHNSILLVRELLEQGADVNAVGDGQFTALHYAAKYGYLEIVKLLWEKYANLLDNYNHETPLHLAASNNHLEVIQYLLADLKEEGDHIILNGKNLQGHTASNCAYIAGNFEVAHCLDDHLDEYFEETSGDISGDCMDLSDTEAPAPKLYSEFWNEPAQNYNEEEEALYPMENSNYKLQ